MQSVTFESLGIVLASAAFVGLVHSLAPGHWLPVVLMAKAKRWSLMTSLVGALVMGLGHIFVSICLGLLAMWVGVEFLAAHEGKIEHYAGYGVASFGLLYAANAFFRHKSCHGHTHHGPSPHGRVKKSPFLFLFSIGFSPCVAVLPVFAAAAALGPWAVGLSVCTFSFGVLAALIGATFAASLGLMKLDHPIFEHYGDVLTGVGVAIMGLVLTFLDH